MRKPVPFGDYLLLDRIAVGGMAELFSAKTRGADGAERLVAVKRMLPPMSDTDAVVAMFKDEANIALCLKHPNIVQAFDSGEHNDTLFIAMEYISGRDVRLLINKLRKQNELMPVPVACFIMERMCDALDYAHRHKDAQGVPREIIHCDISPQNVLVSYEGDVKLIDFGIAKVADGLQQTEPGVLKGKSAYMSPEQARELPIDHRSDLFAAGVTFFEMLTGTKLFTGESDAEVLKKVRSGDVSKASAINPLVTPELEKILSKALEKDRDDRYQWASELQADLADFLRSRDEVVSTEALGAFMRDVFELEVTKEAERVHRWWATEPEEASGLAPPATPIQPPSGQKVRIGPTGAVVSRLNTGGRSRFRAAIVAVLVFAAVASIGFCAWTQR